MQDKNLEGLAASCKRYNTKNVAVDGQWLQNAQRKLSAESKECQMRGLQIISTCIVLGLQQEETLYEISAVGYINRLETTTPHTSDELNSPPISWSYMERSIAQTQSLEPQGNILNSPKRNWRRKLLCRATRRKSKSDNPEKD